MRSACRSCPAPPELAKAIESIGFYFDVGGVLIPDPLGQNPREIFRQFGQRYDSVDPQRAYDEYLRLQPQLDLGTAGLPELCRAIGRLTPPPKIGK
jgi:hypothetical protein